MKQTKKGKAWDTLIEPTSVAGNSVRGDGHSTRADGLWERHEERGKYDTGDSRGHHCGHDCCHDCCHDCGDNRGHDGGHHPRHDWRTRRVDRRPRCEANKKAGHIRFLTGYGYFPSVSVGEVIVASEKGWFKAMCLDVEVIPSLPGESMTLLSANEVQFAAHDFASEAAGVSQGADVKMVLTYGWAPITTLLVPADSPITKLEEFKGKVIATANGDVGTPIETMLATVGLKQGVDYEAQASGYDPFVITQAGIAGKASYRSADPYQLKAGGVDTRAFNPEDYGVPDTFGSILASGEFIRNNPTAAEDFIRAEVYAWAYSIQDSNTAELVGYSQKLTEGDFDAAQETNRWTVERNLCLDHTLKGHPYGWMDPTIVQKEMDGIQNSGVLAQAPKGEDLFTNDLIDAVYDSSGQVIWPGPMGTAGG